MLHDYVKVSKGSLANIIMDGGDPISLANLLYVPPVMPYPTYYRFAIQFAEIQNRSGGVEGFIGIGARLDKSRWKYGKWVDATTTYTDQSVAAKEVATSNDVTLETTTNNDGFVIAGLDLFNLIDFYVTTASIGGATRTLEYTKADGTWGSITNAYVMPPTGAEWVTSGSHENVIAFEPPVDWDKAVSAHGTNIPVGYYCIRVRSTVAGGTAGLARSITVANSLIGAAQLGNNIIYIGAAGSGEHCFSCLSDGLVMFASTPAAQNVFRCSVRTMG